MEPQKDKLLARACSEPSLLRSLFHARPSHASRTFNAECTHRGVLRMGACCAATTPTLEL